MKKFLKDYADLCKETKNFYKDHWVGAVVVNVVSGVLTYAYLEKDTIKNLVQSKLRKEDEEL